MAIAEDQNKSRTFYVIVRNENDKHWTTHTDFVDGRFFADQASASRHLDSFLKTTSTSSPLSTTFPSAVLRPSPNTRSVSTCSANSTSTLGTTEGVKYEVRRIAARSLCGSWTWWFVDEAESS